MPEAAILYTRRVCRWARETFTRLDGSNSQPARRDCQASSCEILTGSLMKMLGEAHFADLFRRVTMNILMSYRRFFRNR